MAVETIIAKVNDNRKDDETINATELGKKESKEGSMINSVEKVINQSSGSKQGSQEPSLFRTPTVNQRAQSSAILHDD